MKQENDPMPASQEERLAAIRRQGRIANAKRKRRSDIMTATSVGAFLIAAVVGAFSYVDHTRRSQAAGEKEPSEKSAAPEIITTASLPPTQAVSPEPATPVQVAAEVEALVADEAPPETAIVEAAKQGMEEEAALTLLGLDSGRDEAKLRDEEMLTRAISGKDWEGYRKLIGKSISAALPEFRLGEGIKRFSPLWEEPLVDRALLRWRTLGWISPSIAVSATADNPGEEFFKWLLNDNAAMQEFLMTVRQEDDMKKVVDFLVYAWASNRDTYQKYYPLALACAVVFDEPMRITHVLGESDSSASVEVDPVERYLWYVNMNEKGRLASPVDRLSASDLVWVVCAPVVTSELEWSLDKMHLRRNTFGKAYGMIEYLMERAVDGLNPYEEYSFEEILKEGGICGDQTYFTINTARAHGVPAIGLSGETSLGGHAWVALKSDTREWDTGIGRIGGVSKGQAQSPQTRSAITEQEIQLWSDRHHQSPAVTLAVWRHLWLAEFFRARSDEEGKVLAIHIANKIGRSFVETWGAMYGLLKEQTEMVGKPPKPANLDEWKSFAYDMRREFRENPRMAQLAGEAELEYIFPYGSANEAKTAFIRDRRRIVSESGEQMDLIAESLKREADMMIKRGDENAHREISQLYDDAMREYGANITGFKMMAQDYFGFFKDDPELGRKTVRDIELAFMRVVETGTKEWFRASTETSIYKMICGYYREVGDGKRAELLESRYEVQMRRAKRAAD